MTTFKDLPNGAKCKTPAFPNGDIFTKDETSASPVELGCTRCNNNSPMNAISNHGHRVHFCPDTEIVVEGRFPIDCTCDCCGMGFPHSFEAGDSFQLGADPAYCPLCIQKMTTPPVVVPSPEEPIHITQCRQIVKEKQAQGIKQAGSKKKYFCDMLTANMLITVWDAIKPEFRVKLAALPLMKQINICWKMVK